MNPDNNKNDPAPTTDGGDMLSANTISEYMINARDAN
jgi:hypothetical protein